MKKTLPLSAAACAAALALGPAGLMGTADAAAKPANTSAAAPAAAARVSAAVSPRSATKGQALTFTGRTTARAKIVVQRKAGSTWRSAARTGTASAGGSYKVVTTHAVAANAVYRVASVSGKKTTYSSALTVALQRPARWYALADHRPLSGGLFRWPVIRLGDNTYDYGVGQSSWGIGAMVWQINGTCTRFTGYAGAGAADTSHNTKRQVEILADGRRLFSQWFALGSGADVDVSLRGAKRVTVALRQSGEYDAGEYGVGNAQVLCTVPPGEYNAAD